MALALLFAACGSDGSEAVPGALDGAFDGAEPAAEPFEGMTAVEVAVGGSTLHVVVADSAAERSAGLRDRTDPSPYDGLLFVVPADSGSAFTMSGVSDPLDLALYSADGTRIGGHDLAPCPDGSDCPSYPPDEPWRYALETPPGDLPDGPLEAVTADR